MFNQIKLKRMSDVKALRAAAKEMNEVIGLVDDDGNDVVITKGATEEELTKIIKGAIPIIQKTDKFSDETQEVIDELSAEGEEDEKEDEKEDEPQSLYDEVDGTKKLADLKEIANSNSEFKSLRKKLATYKTANDLKEAMLDILDEEATEIKEKAEELHKKNIASKPVRVVTEEEDEEEDEKPKAKGKKAPVEDEEEDEAEEDEKPKRKSGPPKGVRPNFKKEGSMAEFMDNLVKEGGDWDELAKACAKEGKKRELRTKFTPSTMKAHVKFRLSKEPKFLGKLKMTEDGIE